MCEACEARGQGWKGWADLPPPAVGAATGPWLDLSHVITEGLSRSPKFPQPKIRKIVSQPAQDANVTEIEMVVHHGTHVDSPRHFYLDGPAFEAIPLDRLYGPGVVWRIEKGPHAVITADDLKELRPKVRAGEIVMLDTGWAARMNRPDYEDHASLSDDAAQWLVDHRVKMLAVDFSTPDLTSHRRPENFDFPVHHILLSQGVLIAEHVANVAPLAGCRVEAMFMAISIEGSDGGPARVVARTVAD